MDIDEYISLTRTISNREPVIDMYQSLYKLISKAFGNSVNLPKLKIVYSLQRTSEIVNISGVRYLIYDQYLGQTMNTFNRILLYSKDPGDGQAYILKLLAENYATRGRFHLAWMLAMGYRKMIGEYSSYKQEKNPDYHHQFTVSQELFVLAHEVAHFIIREPSLFPELSIDNSLSANTPENQIRRFNHILRAMARFLDMEPVSYTGAGIKGSISHNIYGLARLIPQIENSDLNDECFCDVAAALVVLADSKGGAFSKKEVVMLAIEMGMRHLRTLAFIKSMCSTFDGAASSNEPSVALSLSLIQRTSNMRSWLETFPEAWSLYEGRPSVIALSDRHEELIDDPLSYLISGPLIDAIHNIEGDDSPQHERKVSLEEIAAVTGFYQG
jgi:hypothetical protein